MQRLALRIDFIYKKPVAFYSLFFDVFLFAAMSPPRDIAVSHIDPHAILVIFST